MIAARQHGRSPVRRRWSYVCALVAVLTLALAEEVTAADPDLARAEELLRAGKYQEAYDLLSPFEEAKKGDATFDYLLGRAALGTDRADKALTLFERSLATRPDTVAAHLALGRAYFALGRYAEAKIEFETVLRVEDLPPDLLTQVETYDEMARQYLDEARRLTSFGYAEIGIGRYRVNSTPDTTGGERHNTFYNARVGGGLNYLFDNGYALDANLDYRFTYQDVENVRNDSDWRWRLGGSRAFGENNVAIAFRGRVSYRGGGMYRNDYGIVANYRYRLDAENQLTFGAQLERRRYPEGRLHDRSRTLADASIGWVRSLFAGRGSLSLTGHGGYQYATARSDGNSTIYGATAQLDYTFTPRLDGFIFAWWEHDAFNADRIHYHPDSLDEAFIFRRNDNLYEFGGGLVWEFVKTWSLRPQILYIRDQSNAVGFNYSSTEVWVNVRKAF